MSTPAIQTLARGASLHRFEVAGHNILLSYPHPALYTNLPHPFFGETIGRVANRIENARIDNLNGQTYKLAANNGPNTLHGGAIGWGKRDWKGPTSVRRGDWDTGISAILPAGWSDPGGKGREGIVYEYTSPHLEENFPASVKATVWYFEGRGTKGEVVLDSEYEVTLVDDGSGVDETVVAVTNHSYFNLNARSSASSPTLKSHTLLLPANIHQTLSDNPGIPDGTLSPHRNVPVANEHFQLYNNATSEAVPIDDCFICPPQTSPQGIKLDTRSEALHLLAEIRSGETGISLRVESTEPAYQCYTGGFIDVPAWEAGEVDGQSYEGGPGFAQHAGLCIEPSRWVNAAGREDWRDMVLLKRGGVYGARTRYIGWKD